MLDWINDFLSTVIGSILSVLPQSPFRGFISELEGQSWLGYFNWICPVGTFVKIGTAWLAAIAVFYAWQVVLRWAKAVEG